MGQSYLAITERWLDYRGRLQCFSAMLVLFGSGRLAVLERWLPCTVTILDRFHCSIKCMSVQAIVKSTFSTF